MRVEYSKDSKARPKKKKKNTKSKSAIIISIIIIFVSVFTALSLTVFFNVESINVTGESQYTIEQIISASEINIGSNLIRLSISECENNIEQHLPYIGEAKITRVFPNSVSINVKPATMYAAIKADDRYVIIDENYKVLSISEEKPNELLLLRNIEADTFTAGVKVEFKNNSQKDSLNQLIGILSNLSFVVTQIDVNSAVDVNFCIENRLYIKLGSVNNLNEKMTHLTTTLKTLEPSIKGSVSLADWSENNKKATLVYEDINKYLG